MKQHLIWNFQNQTIPALCGLGYGLGITYAFLGYVYPQQLVVSGFLLVVSLIARVP